LMPFVCVKDGRFDYRSVGVDRIMIHPGSVLFKENPEFIVAGEIVHTSRTYARSVSPLRKEWLAEIHPELPRRLLAKAKVGKGARIDGKGPRTDKRESKTEKDTTSQIWVGGESFPLSATPGKGKKKRAVLEWSRLHTALAKAGETSLPDFGAMRGTLLLGRDEVLPDSKVNTIIKAAKLLDPKKDVRETAPRGNFHVDKPAHRDNLVEELENLLKVTRGGKKQKKGGMGFVALYSDGEGHYWFKAIKSFHGAVSASLESLEDLADHLVDDLDDKQSNILGETYRRVEALLY
jgi:ATP-dependent helicase HrpA